MQLVLNCTVKGANAESKEEPLTINLEDIEAMQDPIERAEGFKTLANQLLQKGSYSDAVSLYSKAIECSDQNPHLHVYYANRYVALM